MNTTFLKSTILLASLMATATDAVTLATEERLAPVVETYLDLMMCANTAEEFQSDTTLAAGYRNAAFALDDKIEESGWSDDLFSTVLLTAQESYRDLELSDQDTREDWQRRHFSGERCERRLAAATEYLQQGIPDPDA